MYVSWVLKVYRRETPPPSPLSLEKILLAQVWISTPFALNLKVTERYCQPKRKTKLAWLHPEVLPLLLAVI